jgi:mRNA interferase RelE/StbE
VTQPQYELQFAPKAIRSLRKLDHAAVRRIRESAEALQGEPRPVGAVMLTGAHGVLRVRTGDYRILYMVDDDRRVVLVVDAGHRRDIYQR